MKKKKLIISSVAAVFILALSWFIYVSIFHHYELILIDVVGDDPYHPAFTLDKAYLDKLFNDKIYVKSFWIERYTSYDATIRENTIWNIGALQLQGNEINKIKYGELPERFSQRESSKDLVVGEQYLVVVHTRGGLGHIAFKIVEEDGVAKIVILDD